MSASRSSAVLEGIEAAAEAGLGPIKVNAVVQRGVNDHAVLDMARHFRGTGHIPRFIEYMDVGNTNGWRLDDVVPAEEMISSIDAVYPLEPVAPNYPGEVANRFRYLDGQGEVGVIASVTQPFCGSCTRARISAEGTLYTCLFATSGTSLRDILRKGEDPGPAIDAVWSSAYRPLFRDEVGADRDHRHPGRDELHRGLSLGAGRRRGPFRHRSGARSHPVAGPDQGHRGKE